MEESAAERFSRESIGKHASWHREHTGSVETTSKGESYLVLRKNWNKDVSLTLPLTILDQREDPPFWHEVTCTDEHVWDYTVANAIMECLDQMPFINVIIFMHVVARHIRQPPDEKLVIKRGYADDFFIRTKNDKTCRIISPFEHKRFRGHGPDAMFVIERDSHSNWEVDCPEFYYSVLVPLCQMENVYCIKVKIGKPDSYKGREKIEIVRELYGK